MKNYVKLFLIILFVLIVIASGIGISYLFYLKAKPSYTLDDETDFKDGEIANNYVFQIKPDFLNTPGNIIYIYDDYFIITKTGLQEDYDSVIHYKGEITLNNREKLISLFNEHIYKTEEDCKDTKYILSGKTNKEEKYNSYCFPDDKEIKELLNYSGELWYVK